MRLLLRTHSSKSTHDLYALFSSDSVLKIVEMLIREN